MASRHALASGLDQLLQPESADSQNQSGSLNPTHGLRDVVSPYMTTREVAAYLRISIRAIYYHITHSRLPSSCRLGRSRRFDKREIDSWMRGLDSLEWA